MCRLRGMLGNIGICVGGRFEMERWLEDVGAFLEAWRFLHAASRGQRD